ncbi:MAG: NADH:flavin oxidoreductase [Planctomyces sp.]|nr:NADH:flavin oxidoreductase [Planctomyces sp.]
MSYPRVATFKTAEEFLERLAELEIDLPLDPVLPEGSANALAAPLTSTAGKIGNRFCILPMEGWDGTTDGQPTDLTRRRWENFGRSGAKLIWGGEAVAVRHDGRANPNQLLINDANLSSLEELRTLLERRHREEFGNTDDLLIGLQLTHSGRYSKPNSKTRMEPRTGYRHPILDRRLGIEDDSRMLTDSDLDQLIEDFVIAAKLTEKAGFRWIDIKHCHGYLGHELLSGFDRPGKYGGSFENRTRFLRNIVAGVKAECSSLKMGVRVSVFDFVPFQPGPEADRTGRPAQTGEYMYAFGGDRTGQGIDLAEPVQFLELLRELGIDLVCTTCGSPYYNPHIQRPALFPPSDGYQPPEDPLVGVHRQISVTALIKQQCPEAIIVGSGYSYLQEWLPNVGHAVVRLGMVDSVGLGRMVLSYPELPADVLRGQVIQRKKICRTFSDCTTAPRNGIVSGCFPLDPFYKSMPERELLVQAKHPTQM